MGKMTQPLLAILIVTLGLGPAGPALAADTDAPAIEHVEAASTPRGEPFVVRASIRDPSGVFDPSLLYRFQGQESFQRVQLVAVPGEADVFVATIPSALLTASTPALEYFIEAYDNEGNGPATKGSAENPIVVTINDDTAKSPDETLPDSNNPNPDPEGEVEDSSLGLWLGIGAGAAAAVVVVAAGVAVGVTYFIYSSRPDTRDEVTISVQGPSPVAVP